MGALLGKLADVMPEQDQSEEPELVYLWPECEQAWGIFWQLLGQWHTGMGGKAGLCLADVRVHLDELGIEQGPDRTELWQLLLAAQDGALEGWATLREREDALRQARQ